MEQVQERGNHFLPLVARLKPHATPLQVETELTAVNQAAVGNNPDQDESLSVFRVVNRMERGREHHRDVVRILSLACGLVLLIALVNLTGQFLVRALGRAGDTAVRLSLGASPFQAVKPGLLESCLLSAAGTLAGLGVAQAGLHLLKPLISPELIANQPLALDGTMLGFALALCLGATLLASALPGAIIARLRLTEILKEGGRSVATGRGKVLRPALVVLQVGLALALLGSFGVLAKGLMGLYRVPLGLDPQGVATFQCRMPFKNDAESRMASQRTQAILARLRALPGVTATGTVSPYLPVQDCGWNASLQLRTGKLPLGTWFEIRNASTGLFRALGVRLLQGRDFEPADYRPDPGVVVVSQSTAARCWPGKDPLGQELSTDGKHWDQVVGVVADVRNAGPADAWADKTVYYPQWMLAESTSFVVRFAPGRPMDLAALRAVAREEAPDWPVARLRTMDEVINLSVQDRTILVQLLGLASILALGLALVGVQGVLGYQVARRTRDLGIRFALGASRRDVVELVLKEALLLAGAGVVLGLGGAWAGARLIAHAFPDSGAAQPATLLGAVLLLLAGAAGASLQPALAASRVQPSEALRRD